MIVDDDVCHGFENSALYQTWQRRVLKSDNDFIVGIAASSRSPISGTGKTTLAVRLARQFDASPDGFDASEQASLSSEKVAEELIPDLPTGTSIIFDEAQGTLASDGVDARRSMANAVVRMARSAAQYRKRQHTLLMVSQSTDWIDSRMMDLLDRLVVIQERGRAVIYDHYRDDLPSAHEPNEYTPSVEEISWQALPDEDPDYQALDELKEQANDKEAEEDHGLSTKAKKTLATELYKYTDKSQSEIAAHDDIDMSQSWVSQVVNGP